MLKVPGRHSDQTRVGYAGASAHIQQPQLVRVLKNALHRGVIKRNATLGVNGDAQFFQEREAGRHRLIFERSGRQSDETVGETEDSELGAALLQLLNVDANRVPSSCAQVGHVQYHQIRTRNLREKILATIISPCFLPLEPLTANATTICWMPVVQLLAKFKCVKRPPRILAISHREPLDIAPLGFDV